MLGWACCCLSSAVLLHCFWSDNDAPSRALRTAGRVSGAWCARACRIPARAATATCARLFNRRFKCALIGVGFLCCVPLVLVSCRLKVPRFVLRCILFKAAAWDGL
ncbi:hypothetical protein ABFS83_07G110000 [Erythranthe nasuta]